MEQRRQLAAVVGLYCIYNLCYYEPAYLCSYMHTTYTKFSQTGTLCTMITLERLYGLSMDSQSIGAYAHMRTEFNYYGSNSMLVLVSLYISSTYTNADVCFELLYTDTDIYTDAIVILIYLTTRSNKQ